MKDYTIPGKKVAKLVCVSDSNNNKFYNMFEQNDGTFKVVYGRVQGTESEYSYPMKDWNSKYRDKIKKEYKVLDSGFRDLLNPNVKSNLFGYRDAKMNVEIDGIIAEIQVNIPEMLEAKSRNHDKYEIISKMDRIVSSENRTFTDEEAQKRNKLIQEMEDDYDSVWNELTKSMKPS